MKLKIIDRILLALYALLGLAVLGLLAAQFLFQYNIVDMIQTFLEKENWVGTVIVAAVLAVAALLSIRWLVLSFRRGARPDRGSVSVQNTENGAVRVSVAAMDVLVRQAIGQVDGVVNLKTHIVNHEDSITVQIDMTLTSDAHIPNVTMKMQRDIKRFIEEFSGIAVREVTILVSDVQALPAPAAPTVEQSAPSVVVVEPEKVESETPAAQEESAATREEAERPVDSSEGEAAERADEAGQEEASAREEAAEPVENGEWETVAAEEQAPDEEQEEQAREQTQL